MQNINKINEHTINELDAGIRDAVILLNNYGFDTFESCQGGEGHCMPEPTIKFWGDEFDCIRAYELCSQCGFRVFEVRRVFIKNPLYNLDETKEIGENWIKPYNEIVFKNPSKH
jgi:hypothetical protein